MLWSFGLISNYFFWKALEMHSVSFHCVKLQSCFFFFLSQLNAKCRLAPSDLSNCVSRTKGHFFRFSHQLLGRWEKIDDHPPPNTAIRLKANTRCLICIGKHSPHSTQSLPEWERQREAALHDSLYTHPSYTQPWKIREKEAGELHWGLTFSTHLGTPGDGVSRFHFFSAPDFSDCF